MDANNSLAIQKCEEHDLDLLISISRQTFKDAFEHQNNPEDFKTYLNSSFSKEKLSLELQNPDSEFYFVFVNDKIAGYFKVNQYGAQTDVKDADTIELERIYVLNEFQGKGIGKELMNAVKEIALEAEKKFLWLGVWEKNEGAIRFYQKNGFSKFGTHPYPIGDDVQTDWLMRFDLS